SKRSGRPRTTPAAEQHLCLVGARGRPPDVRRVRLGGRRSHPNPSAASGFWRRSPRTRRDRPRQCALLGTRGRTGRGDMSAPHAPRRPGCVGGAPRAPAPRPRAERGPARARYRGGPPLPPAGGPPSLLTGPAPTRTLPPPHPPPLPLTKSQPKTPTPDLQSLT